MHIAYISHEYPPDTGKGGIGTYTYQMAAIMQQRGHVVEVFAASFHREISEQFENILTHRVLVGDSKEFPAKVAPVFARAHAQHPFNLIECPEIGGEAAIIHSQFPVIPLVVRLHTPAVLVTRLLNTYTPLYKKLRFVAGSLLRCRPDMGYWSKHDKNQHLDPDYLITEKAAIITAPSEAMKQWAVKFWRIAPQRISVVPNPYVPSAALLDVQHSKENRQITFMGRLNVLKGIVAFTYAAKKVLKKYPHWTIQFVGNDEASPIAGMSARRWIEEQLAAHSHQISFLGWVEYSQLPHVYAHTDIAVVPSLFESFSYVCAEAMSAGCALVGSRQSAMRELLGHNEFGLLVNPKSATQLAKAIIRLIENPGLRAELGIKARQRVLSEYNAETIGAMQEKIYLSHL